MKCWNCAHPVEIPPSGVVPFRATCDKCSFWQHCCKNCVHYSPGKPNDCNVPGTDPIADREACNFCDEFSIKGEGPKEKTSTSSVEERLFGKSEGEDDKKDSNPFDSLFS